MAQHVRVRQESRIVGMLSRNATGIAIWLAVVIVSIVVLVERLR